MYSAYLTLYMLALGLTKAQVGIVTSIGLAANFFFASISAYVTDRLGRKRTTLIFDSISWIGAQLIWANAKNMTHLVIAGIVNASVQVVSNSFTCLLLEDNQPKDRVHIFNFMQISGILAGFFAPIGTILINRMTLIPAVRTMQFFGAFSITLQIVLRHILITETSVGKQKMKEMKDVKVWQIFKAYLPIFKRVLKSKLLVYILLLRSLNFIQYTIRNTYLAVLVTERWGFKAGTMSIFHTLNAVVILLVLVFISPILMRAKKRWPLLLGICVHISAILMLLLTPPRENIVLLVLSGILIPLGVGLTTPYIDTLAANAMVEEDRAASNSVAAMTIMLLSSPFGYIGGVLSGIDPRAPFLMTLCIFITCLFLLSRIVKIEKESKIEEE